jgi:glutamyl/glutaminyl-tRNA synthetase
LGLDWDKGPIAWEAAGPPGAIQATVTDDQALGITHLVSPYERRSELATYEQLCRARGWAPPQCILLPALAPGSSLTRPASLLAAREQGYLPLAVANDLARMGWTPRGKRALLSLDELAARFDPSRLSRAPVRPLPGQLDWLNRRCLAELDPAQRTALFAARWQQAYGLLDRAAGTGLAPSAWRELLAEAVATEVGALGEVPARVRFAFVDEIDPCPDAASVLAHPYASSVLEAFVHDLSTVEPYAYDRLDAAISALRLRLKEALGVRSRDVLHVARAALTGRMDGPCLVVACQLLGRERCLWRAQQHIQRAGRPLYAAERP